MTADCHTQYHWAVCHPLNTLNKEGPFFTAQVAQKPPGFTTRQVANNSDSLLIPGLALEKGGPSTGCLGCKV